MFNRFFKKLSKFLAVLLTTILALIPLSYAQTTGGVIHANVTNLPFFNSKAEHVYDKIKERPLDLYPCVKLHDRVWAEYYYNNYNVNKDDNSPKYDLTVNGFMVGFDIVSSKMKKERISKYDEGQIGEKEYILTGKLRDYTVTGNEKAYNIVEGPGQWVIGIMGGYGASEQKQEQDKAKLNDINLGFYGGYIGEKWDFKGMLLGGYEQYNIDRNTETKATSDHDGYSAALDLEAGYKIALNKNSKSNHKLFLVPFIGVIGGYVNNENYEEEDGDDLMKVKEYENFTAEARAGLGIKGKVKKFGWYARAGVRQLLTEKYNEIELSLLNSDEYGKIKSAENAQTTITGGLGADYDLSDSWVIFANGLGNFADVSTNYYANIGVIYKFGCINNKPRKEEDQALKKAQEEKKKQEELAKQQQEKLKKQEELAKQQQEKLKKQKEKELKSKMQKQEAKVVSEEQAQKMKKKVIKNIKFVEKPTFVFGTDKLNNRGKESLRQVAKELENYPDADVLIEGYTDNVGSDEVNQKISERRAAAIATTLKNDYNVKNDISVIGKGKKDPIASNDTAAGRAKNRRVEVMVTTAIEE
ncbi:MAG: autotransporter domain-containing protein [Elusimicrobia bacterium]|nr:autotransporter domain-containing protein [Elusimicrobiota bacterium]